MILWSKEGFTTDDIVKHLSGDFAIIFSDIAVTEKETEYELNLRASRQPNLMQKQPIKAKNNEEAC